MKEFTSSVGFIIFVLYMILGVSMVFGEKFATYFLWLILLGMLVVNADKVTSLIGRFSSPGTSITDPQVPPKSGSDEWNKLDLRGGVMS